MNNEETSPNLDTNVRLLSQRVATTEHQLNRIGDSVRLNTTDIHKLEAQVSKNDELLIYRLDQIVKAQSETANRFWALGLGLAASFLLQLFKVVSGN